MKEDEIGIGITDAGSLSLKAGEGAGVYTTKYKRVVEKTRHPPIFDLSLLVPPKYDRTKSDFGEGDGFFVGQRVAEFLKKAATSSGNIDDADFWWSGTSSGVAPIDLVCYVFDSIDQSLVAQHMGPGATLKSKAGNTVWSPEAQAMISEVYIAGAMYFAANLGQRDRVLAISIIHELMHNRQFSWTWTRACGSSTRCGRQARCDGA